MIFFSVVVCRSSLADLEASRSIDQSSLEFIKIYLPLLSSCWDLRLGHHDWLVKNDLSLMYYFWLPHG